MKKVAELLAARQQNWEELQILCSRLEGVSWRKLTPADLERFGSLYRSACADLALADAYQLPQQTVGYLHQLVGRAHNQLYRSRRFNFTEWAQELALGIPNRLRRDPYFWLALCLFWGFFLASMLLAMFDPQFAVQLLGKQQVSQYEEMYSQAEWGRDMGTNTSMAGFYIQHNTSIGLQSFATGLIGGVGGVVITVFNACILGTVFGYMATTPYSDTFFEFVTAHGPFELTAIVLAAAAGMRLGFSVVDPGGLTRLASLKQAGRQTIGTVGLSILLFVGAAMIEGYLSPSAAPYFIKAATAIACSALLVCYLFLPLLLRRPDVAT